MSLIASMKNIDIQRYAVMLLLDEMGIDVNPQDGRIYYPENPEALLRINDKIVRLDIGKPKKNLQYTIFNPILREDHAQYLATLAIHSLLFSDQITIEEAENPDFEIDSILVANDDNGNAYEVAETRVTMSTAKGSCVGQHVEPAVATTMAIVEYLKLTDYLGDTSRNKIFEHLNLAYMEYLRLDELKVSERKNEIKNKNAMLEAPDKIPEEYLNIDADELGEFAIDDENMKFPDCPEQFIDFDTVDFEREDPIEEEIEIEDDLTDEEMAEMGLVWDAPEPKVIPIHDGVKTVLVGGKAEYTDVTPSVDEDELDDSDLSNPLLQTNIKAEIIELNEPPPQRQQALLPAPPTQQQVPIQMNPYQQMYQPVYPMYNGFQQGMMGFGAPGYQSEEAYDGYTIQMQKAAGKAMYDQIEDIGDSPNPVLFNTVHSAPQQPTAAPASVAPSEDIPMDIDQVQFRRGYGLPGNSFD